MSIPQLTTDLNIIQTLDDEPNDVTGLTSSQLKAKYDEAVNIIKTYLNLNTPLLMTAADAGDIIAGTVNIIDPITAKKYVYVVENGSPGIKEVL